MSAGAEILCLAGAAIFGVGCWMMYQIFRPVKYEADLQQRECMIYSAVMNKLAIKKGINIEKELIKSNILAHQGRSFSKELHEEIVKEFFGEKKDEKEAR